VSMMTLARMTIRSRSIFICLIAAGALVGAWAEQLLFYRLTPSSAALSWTFWLKSALADVGFKGAIAGALLAYLGWMLRNPRMHMRRSAMVGVAANAAAWAAFLIAVPPLTPADFELNLSERARRDAESGLHLITHQPVIVAARPHVTYFPDNGGDLLLEIFAEPAIVWTASLTVPPKYGGALATRRESFIIAGGGFILSAAFWVALAPAVSSTVRFCRMHLRQRRVRTVGG